MYINLQGHTLHLAKPIYIHKGTVTFRNGYLYTDSSSEAAIHTYGGTVYLGDSNNEILKIYNTHVTNKVAGTEAILMDGGAVSMAQSRVTIESGVGDASGYAAAVFVRKGTFTMKDGTVFVNATNKDGVGTTGFKSYGSESFIRISGGSIRLTKIRRARCLLCAGEGGEIYMNGGSIRIDNAYGENDDGTRRYGFVFWAQNASDSKGTITVCKNKISERYGNDTISWNSDYTSGYTYGHVGNINYKNIQYINNDKRITLRNC